MEAHRSSAALGQEEAIRVEPGLAFAEVEVGARPGTLLRVAGERLAVEGEPGFLVLADPEGADRDAVGDLGFPEGGQQRAAHRPERAHPHESGGAGQRGRRGQITVRPEPERPRPGLGQQRAGEGEAEPVTAVRRVNDQFPARALDRVGRIQVGIPGQLGAPGQSRLRAWGPRRTAGGAGRARRVG